MRKNKSIVTVRARGANSEWLFWIILTWINNYESLRNIHFIGFILPQRRPSLENSRENCLTRQKERGRSSKLQMVKRKKYKYNARSLRFIDVYERPQSPDSERKHMIV